MPKRGGSRGRKKPSLHDLTRELPDSHEFESFVKELDSMDARAVALVLTSFVEHWIETAIATNFVPLTESEFNDLFRVRSAPLGSLSAKIALAHALGIFTAEARKHLDTMRHIRNAFAHSMQRIDFDHPMMAEECRKLDPSALLAPFAEMEGYEPRKRFTTFGTSVALYLMICLVRRETLGHNFRSDPQPLPPEAGSIFDRPPPHNSQNQD